MIPHLRLRAAPSFRHAGIACSCLFTLFLIGSVWAALANPDGSFPHPIAAGVFLGLFWGAWLLLSLWIWRFSIRYCLEITGDAIRQTTAFRQKSMRIQDIILAKWRRWPVGGSIKLKTSSQRMTIELSIAGDDPREELIAILRSRLPRDVQVGWQHFAGVSEEQ